MKRITFTADEALIAAARERARAGHTTLGDAFRRWLADYVQDDTRLQHYDATMARLRGRLKVGRKLTRDEMNRR